MTKSDLKMTKELNDAFLEEVIQNEAKIVDLEKIYCFARSVNIRLMIGEFHAKKLMEDFCCDFCGDSFPS